MNWRENVLDADDEIAEMLANVRTIAVIGIKPESHAMQPAFYVPKYMQDRGYEIIPVPVYYPEVTEILGKKVFRSLAEIPGEVDLVNVFRRSADVRGHLEDIRAKRPKAVWLQLGIRDDQVAQILAQDDIKVVQDACLMVEHRQLMR